MARAGLSVLGSGYSGKAGSVVFARFRTGEVQIRQRDTPHDPQTAKQIEIRRAMQWANLAFRSLDRDEMLAWKRYAERLADQAWSERRPAQANPLNAYRSLALKFLQVNGLTDPPRLPPVSPFTGDGVLVTASGSGSLPRVDLMVRAGDMREGLGEGDPEAPTSARSSAANRKRLRAVEDAGVTFLASGPNSAGVVTELLLQPLRLSVSNPEVGKYRNQAFVSFEPGSLSAFVPVGPGWFSPAVRFVLAATGQSSPLLCLEPVLVG